MTDGKPDDLIADPSSFEVGLTFWMHAAQRQIRKECGWHVAPSLTHTIRLDGYGGDTLVLPSLHVTDLTSVKFDGVEHMQDCAWSRHGTIVLKNGCFPDMPGSIEVTLTDGWDLDEVPELQSLLLSIARRAMSQPAGIVASQSVNGSNVSYFHGSDGSTPGITLFASEQDALAPYRLTYGVRAG